MDQRRFTDSATGSLVGLAPGQSAFLPNALPRRIDLSMECVVALDRASRAVATLAGVGETLPNPHLLIQPFLKREAVLSSRIEGTQASISDIFRFEVGQEPRGGSDVVEVANYIAALHTGLGLLDRLPICLRLINDVHERLLRGVRGQERRPGMIRNEHVWIGPPGSLFEEATYVPPPPGALLDLLKDWESFVNDEALIMPPLVQCALMHYQFEAIHPYFDGNGRVGRLLIILFLCATGVLPVPMLYLSAFFERHRDEYHRRLFDVSAGGEWEAWVRFFLEGVAQEAGDALVRSRRVRQLQDRYRERLQERRESVNAFHALDQLFQNPYITPTAAAASLDLSYAGAQGVLERLVDAGIVQELPGTRPRLYVLQELLTVLEQPEATPG